MRPKANATRQLADRLDAHQGESGIIYCASRRRTEELAEEFSRQGRRALAYHAGLDPQLRREVQDCFLNGELQVIAATSAFGMGVDKPDVRLVVHLEVPGSLEAYLQQAGRAGRPRSVVPAESLCEGCRP